jgi:hypothetical protein
MAPPIIFPPDVINARTFPNVFVFPRNRIFDPDNNVVMVAKLFNFKIDSDETRDDHDLFLMNKVAPVLVGNPESGARIVGLASRSGSDFHNLQLSVRRAKNVNTVLTFFLFPNIPPRTLVGGQGEQFAANLGVKDGTEDAQFRAVLVTVLADRTKKTPVRVLP